MWNVPRTDCGGSKTDKFGIQKGKWFDRNTKSSCRKKAKEMVSDKKDLVVIWSTVTAANSSIRGYIRSSKSKLLTTEDTEGKGECTGSK